MYSKALSDLYIYEKIFYSIQRCELALHREKSLSLRLTLVGSSTMLSPIRYRNFQSSAFLQLNLRFQRLAHLCSSGICTRRKRICGQKFLPNMTTCKYRINTFLLYSCHFSVSTSVQRIHLTFTTSSYPGTYLEFKRKGD